MQRNPNAIAGGVAALLLAGATTLAVVLPSTAPEPTEQTTVSLSSTMPDSAPEVPTYRVPVVEEREHKPRAEHTPTTLDVDLVEEDEQQLPTGLDAADVVEVTKAAPVERAATETRTAVDTVKRAAVEAAPQAPQTDAQTPKAPTPTDSEPVRTEPRQDTPDVPVVEAPAEEVVEPVQTATSSTETVDCPDGVAPADRVVVSTFPEEVITDTTHYVCAVVEPELPADYYADEDYDGVPNMDDTFCFLNLADPDNPATVCVPWVDAYAAGFDESLLVP